MARAIACPRCRREVVLEGDRRSPQAPFCSERCRLLDLGAWSEERYAVSRPLGYDDVDLDEGSQG